MTGVTLQDSGSAMLATIVRASRGVELPLSLSRVLAIVGMLIVVSACDDGSRQRSVPVVDQGPTWTTEMRARRAQVDEAIRANRASFDAYDSVSLGDASLEMLPYVVFRVLQELEPSVLGEQAVEATGFFARPDMPSGRHGITWTRPVAVADGTFTVRYMTRTCAACHTGRVRLEDGSTRVLHGGSNSEMNVHLFNGRLMQTLRAKLGISNDTQEYKNFRKRIADALASKPPDWFWGNGTGAVPAEAAAKEVETVQANLDKLLAAVRVMNDRRLDGLSLLKKVSYDKVPNAPSLVDGAPGLDRKSTRLNSSHQ